VRLREFAEHFEVESHLVQQCLPLGQDTVCDVADADDWLMPQDEAVCFRLLGDAHGATGSPLDDLSPTCAQDGWNLEFAIERIGASPAGSRLTVSCRTSEQPETDCPNLPP
jgi:hypothetical protein